MALFIVFCKNRVKELDFQGKIPTVLEGNPYFAEGFPPVESII